MDGSVSTWLAHRTWYAIASSSDIDDGQLHGADFFGHRLVVYRDTDGTAIVLGGQCPHMGADLSLARSSATTCSACSITSATGVTARARASRRTIASRRARGVPSFLARERWGVIWIFNGDDPDTDPPGIRD